MKTKLLISAAALITAIATPSCVAPYHPVAHASVGISSLPHGYQTIHHGGLSYYFANNIWYRRSNGKFFKTSRPLGYKGSIGSFNRSRGIASLPHGYKSFSHKGSTYYSNGSKFYRKSNGKFINVGRPSGLQSRTSNGRFPNGQRSDNRFSNNNIEARRERFANSNPDTRRERFTNNGNTQGRTFNNSASRSERFSNNSTQERVNRSRESFRQFNRSSRSNTATTSGTSNTTDAARSRRSR